jgi:hypothetical protein
VISGKRATVKTTIFIGKPTSIIRVSALKASTTAAIRITITGCVRYALRATIELIQLASSLSSGELYAC